MENEKNLDRLSGLLYRLCIIAIIGFFCWYFRSVLIYVVIAFVVSLIGHPLMRLLRKIKIRGKSMPDGLLAVFSIFIIILSVLVFITQLIPIVTNIVRDAQIINGKDIPYDSMLDQVNAWVIGLFPSLGKDFNLVSLLLSKIKEVMNFSNISSVLGSVASVASAFGVAIFSVVFISFFFIKDEKLFSKIICSFVPDKNERNVQSTIIDITHLLSRYFIGLIIEVFGVIVLDFLGLWWVVQIGPSYALGIAFIAGLLNIIPYVGPILGYVIGILLCIVLKYGTGAGLDVPIWAFILIIWAVMLFAQAIDNFVFQPLIYSTSIKARPLEIFLVLLMAGRIGGTIGLIAGVPAYTVVRVILARFYSDRKLVRRLMPDIEKENTDMIL
ncbi:MAG: AI-2E family transporter [Bacteroidales bacterium]|nr:AI-2E family transporter [Bacteroidales bacterium]